MTTSNHHYPPNSTLMSKTTHQQQQYIIPMHHTNIFHIPFFSLQQASVTANTSLIHFLLVMQQISCLHNIARPLSNIPYNRKINLASLFFCFFKYDSCSIWQNKNKYSIFEMLQLIFKKCKHIPPIIIIREIYLDFLLCPINHQSKQFNRYHWPYKKCPIEQVPVSSWILQN